MRVPIRKPGKYTHNKIDGHMTREKYEELKKKLEKWKKFSRPQAAEEVKRLAAFGDFSENAEYQIAKGRLRSLNQRILETEDILKRAEIIDKNNGRDIVSIGSTVTIETGGKQRIYQILGSSETDPSQGIISNKSPIGSALIGRRVGDEVRISLQNKEVKYKIIKIN